MNELVDLAQALIAMRKYPLKDNGARRYPAAAQQFAALATHCTDADALQAVIDVDTGHVLPPPTKQVIFEKLLDRPAYRTSANLRAFALHLVMFGYTEADGTLNSDVDERVNALFAEADETR